MGGCGGGQRTGPEGIWMFTNCVLGAEIIVFTSQPPGAEHGWAQGGHSVNTR